MLRSAPFVSSGFAKHSRRCCVRAMTLAAGLDNFEAEFDALSNHFRDFAASKPSIGSASSFTLLEECLLEGLLSRCWQSWCIFCRTCVIASCVGTTNSAGALIPPLPQATDGSHCIWGGYSREGRSVQARRIGDRQIQFFALNQRGGMSTFWRGILTRLYPSNAGQLLAAFSSGASSAKAMQLIRNCAAHNNWQSRAGLQKIQSAYIVFAITHPTHALFWIEPNSKDFLITRAMENLEAIGFAAIS